MISYAKAESLLAGLIARVSQAEAKIEAAKQALDRSQRIMELSADELAELAEIDERAEGDALWAELKRRKDALLADAQAARASAASMRASIDKA